MKPSTMIGIGLIVALLGVAAAVPAFAGGWAVVTLDSLPHGVAAGKALTIGFTVRQHGVTLLSSLDPAPQVTARSAATGEAVRSTADDDGRGHYSARLTLPTAGEWTWGIQAFGGQVQPMPAIVVSGAAPPSLESPGRAAPAALGVVAAGVAALGIGLAISRRFVASGIAIVLAAIAAGASIGGDPPVSSTVEAAAPSALDQGAALFVAKGCIVCHVNTDTAQSESTSHSIGPDLTHYSNDPAFLSRWLDKPAAVRPATTMPDLGLSADEIDALITFLNGEGGA